LDLPFRLVRVSRSVVFGFIGMPAMLVVASASDLFDSQVDKLVLTHVVGPQASGMFQIGVNLEQVLKNAALVPLAVMLAGTAELYRSNPGRLRHLEMLAGSTAQAIASIAAGGIILFARPFMTVWLGPGYGHAALSAQALAIAALLNIWSAPWTYYAIGRRRYHYVLIAASTTVVVNFVATIVLTSTIGLDGALIGSVAGSAAGTLVARLVLLKWERRSWLTPALVTTGLTGLVVGPLAYIAMPFAATWPSLIAWGSLYVALTGVLLLAAGVLPVRVALRAGQLRLVIREPTPTRRHSVRRHT
jgi:O-antigen/teichoic acid export membrane protein